MKIDRELAREIKAANGDGSRDVAVAEPGGMGTTSSGSTGGFPWRFASRRPYTPGGSGSTDGDLSGRSRS